MPKPVDKDRSDDYTYPGGVPPNDLPEALRVCRCGHHKSWHEHAASSADYCVSEGECFGCEHFRPVSAAPQVRMAEVEGVGDST